MHNNTIEIKLVTTNVMTRWPCTVCGWHTEKVPILAESEDPSCCIRVCEQCLEEGQIDARLTERAQQIPELRSLVGRLRVPTYEQWTAACEQWEAHRRSYD
jgi:hypothetical protein